MIIKNIFSGAIMLLALLYAVPVPAHVEGHMPDSVAEMEYRILLEFKPGDLPTLVKLATVLMNQGKFEEAEEELRKVLGLKPDDLQAHIGMTRLRLRQGKVPEALATIKRAVAIDPDRGIVYLYYGMALEADKRPREAMEIYRIGLRKLEKNSSDPEYQHDREQLTEALNKLENNPGK